MASIATLALAPATLALAPSAELDPTTTSAAPHRIYVTNEQSGTLSVIDSAKQSIVKTLTLGKRPRGLQLSRDGKLLYVALSGSPILPPGVDESKAPPADKSADGIGIVDVASLRLLRVLTGVSDPEQLAISRDGTRLYVASEDTGQLLVLDAQKNRVIASVRVGEEPEGVGISPDGRLVYVTSEERSEISVLATANNSVIAKFAAGKRPRVAAFAPDGSRAYVSGELDASLSIVDTQTHTIVRTLHLDGENVRPMGIAPTNDGKRLFVATGRGNTVVAIDLQNFNVGRVEVGQRPWNIALSPDGELLYSANGLSDNVSIVDTRTLKVVGTIGVGTRPWGVVVGPMPK